MPGAEEKLVHKIVMTHGVEPSSFSNVILMIFVLSLCCALSGRFVSVSHKHAKIVLLLFVLSLLRISPFQGSSHCFSFGPFGAFKDVVPVFFRDLHGDVESICTSNFFCAFFNVSLNSLSSGST